VWRALPGVTGRVSAYSALRQPTINELYRSFTLTASGVSTVTSANPALANEMLRGVEAGVDWAPVKGVHLSGTVFWNRLGHAIANVTLPGSTATSILRQRQNVDAIRARGVEIDGGVVWRKLSLDGSLALTDSVVEASGDLGGMRPAQTPRVAASASLGWRPWAGWRAVASVRHVGAQYEDDKQAYVMPAATTLGAFVSAPVGRGWAVVLRGENLGDARVQTRNQAGSIDFGAPRTLWAGLRFGRE
jgi:vitamin B12 transporter